MTLIAFPVKLLLLVIRMKWKKEVSTVLYFSLLSFDLCYADIVYREDPWFDQCIIVLKLQTQECRGGTCRNKKSSPSGELLFCRGGRIRTCGPLVPNQVL